MRHALSRRSVLAAGALTVTASALPTSTAKAANPRTTSAASTGATVTVEAGYLRISLDSTGTVVALVDTRSGIDYCVAGKTASLVSLVVDGQQVRPTAVARVGRNGEVLRFTNQQAHVRVDVAVGVQPGYTTLEVIRADVRPGADLQTLLWGPFATSITQTIGESVGVVRDDQFAIGLRPLTDRTEGAWPQEYQQYGWESEVEDNPSQLQVSPLEEWSAAGKTAWGTVLRAFTFDYSRARERHNGAGRYPIPVGPLPSDSAQVLGSRIALFGASPEMTPTVLSSIAQHEDLPYPTQNGQWQKASHASSQSFLVLSDLQTNNIPAAAQFARAAGLDYVYSLPNSYGPWQSTGHYQFNASLGSSDPGAAHAVDVAHEQGIRLGVHTLSDFISTDDEGYDWALTPRDPYLGPPADPRLVTGGSAALSRPLTADDTTLYTNATGAAALFATAPYFHLVRIDNEFLSYDTVDQIDTEWRATGLRRGRWGSVAAAHTGGTKVARGIANSYGGAIGGLAIIDEIAARLATAWNDTGVMANSYDGVESSSESGWGSYGQARLINSTYAQTRARDGFITETSRMTSNTWDALTRASWGEVGVTSMDQVFINNQYYQANFLPGMLGWIGLNGTESLFDLETTLARGAGLDAGAGFQTSIANLTAGTNTTQLLDAIAQWETARNLGAFTEQQRAQFRDRSTYWHLTPVKPGRAWSLQQLDANGNAMGSPQPAVAPTPRMDNRPLPTGTVGQLYENLLTTNTPVTTSFTVTGGALPKGLRLNADTGGIIGVPTQPGTRRFTVTAASSAGQPNASATYTITVRA